jgi:hypothetical protein
MIMATPLLAPARLPLHGLMVGRGGKPNRRRPERRECLVPGCITVLSAYNPHETCWAHTELVPHPMRARPRHDRVI